MIQTGSDVAVAFGITILSGLATALGAAVVFFPVLLNLTTRKALSAACGIAGGVMLYVSLVEVFGESVHGFKKYGLDSGIAYLCGTFCFFSGIGLIMLIGCFTTWLLYDPEDDNDAKRIDEEGQENSDDDAAQENKRSATDDEHDIGDVSAIVAGIEKKKLMKMSFNTGIAIAIHNFPEGVATFVATLQDVRVGAVLAIAIAIHNIPEGFAIALPVFYATGSPSRAFFWGALSGVTEPVAAVFAWLILSNVMGPATFAIVFGIVSGMMSMVAIQELIPAAHRYDPEDTVASKSLVCGMAFMSVSLVIFALVG